MRSGRALFLVLLVAVVMVVAPVRPAVGAPGDADLAVELTATSGGLTRVIYTITVTNNGPAPLESAVIRTGPFSPDEVAGTTAGACRYDGWFYEFCTIGPLTSGMVTSVSFTASATLPGDGEWTVTSVRTSGTPSDPNPSNDSDNATCTQWGYWFMC